MRIRDFNYRRAWLIIAAFTAIFIALGPLLDKNGSLVVTLYKIGILGVPFSAILYTVVYTAFGLRGRARWWTDDVGMAIVTPYIAITVSSIVLAWAELFNHGLLNTPTPVWIDVGSLLAATSLMLWRSAVWLQAGRRLDGGKEESDGSGEPDGGVPADGTPGGGGAAA